jgi:hypothetical protein
MPGGRVRRGVLPRMPFEHGAVRCSTFKFVDGRLGCLVASVLLPDRLVRVTQRLRQAGDGAPLQQPQRARMLLRWGLLASCPTVRHFVASVRAVEASHRQSKAASSLGCEISNDEHLPASMRRRFRLDEKGRPLPTRPGSAACSGPFALHITGPMLISETLCSRSHSGVGRQASLST